MSEQKSRGIPGKIKKSTLMRVGKVFFKQVSVESCSGLDQEVWLICSGLRLKKADLVDTLDYGRINEQRAAYFASHFLQAYLRTVNITVRQSRQSGRFRASVPVAWSHSDLA